MCSSSPAAQDSECSGQVSGMALGVYFLIARTMQIMKNLKTITVLTILFCMFVFALTILDFAALHDIKQDYLSRYILNYLDITLPNDLPDWTSTKGEWHLVTFSLYSRFLFFILNIIVLLYLYRKVASNKRRT